MPIFYDLLIQYKNGITFIFSVNYSFFVAVLYLKWVGAYAYGGTEQLVKGDAGLSGYGCMCLIDDSAAGNHKSALHG
jgi:hypothetical protein